jgi:hypothetical protein
MVGDEPYPTIDPDPSCLGWYVGACYVDDGSMSSGIVQDIGGRIVYADEKIVTFRDSRTIAWSAFVDFRKIHPPKGQGK